MKTETKLKGKLVDTFTRCSHYHSELDIIAIKFKCCDTYYPCFQCHEEEANHKHQIWDKSEFNELAILCGNCKQEMTVNQYLSSDAKCPFCEAAFNPKCQNHYHLYFEM